MALSTKRTERYVVSCKQSLQPLNRSLSLKQSYEPIQKPKTGRVSGWVPSRLLTFFLRLGTSFAAFLLNSSTASLILALSLAPFGESRAFEVIEDTDQRGVSPNL